MTFMEKGKQIFFENQIDMVLLDVNLPDGEGFSFCQWVKKQREVPVIYLTAGIWRRMLWQDMNPGQRITLQNHFQ